MGWADRPGHQEVMLFTFQDKKQFCVIFHIGPMELDADEPRKFQGPPDRILGQPTWVGGGGKILVGRGKAKILFGEEI